MGVNYRRLMREVPRPLEIAARDQQGEKPIDGERVSRAERARRAEPLLGLVAAGHIPLDGEIARLIPDYVEHHSGKIQ